MPPHAHSLHSLSPGRVPRQNPIAVQFPCVAHGCKALCCTLTEVPLLEGDIIRLSAMGIRDFWEEVDGYFLLKNVDGCPFEKGGRCSVHDLKPVACRTYPLVMGDDGPELSSDCPWAEEFAVHREETMPVLIDLLARLEEERRDRMLVAAAEAKLRGPNPTFKAGAADDRKHERK